MNDVMLDLETMGTSPDSAIVAIGAVGFDPLRGELGAEFEHVVSLDSAVAAGGQMDPSTVMWWLRRGDAARAAIAGGGLLPVSIEKALEDFASWLRQIFGDSVRVWGHGADVDNVILGRAYRRLGKEQPWGTFNNRCYRTVKNLRRDIEMDRSGTHHVALDDARSQAAHLIKLLKAIR